MTRLLDTVRYWPHPDSELLPPTHCGECGSKLNATPVIAGYNQHGGDPIRRLLLTCPNNHPTAEWLIAIRHHARYGVEAR